VGSEISTLQNAEKGFGQTGTACHSSALLDDAAKVTDGCLLEKANDELESAFFVVGTGIAVRLLERASVCLRVVEKAIVCPLGSASACFHVEETCAGRLGMGTCVSLLERANDACLQERANVCTPVYVGLGSGSCSCFEMASDDGVDRAEGV
jgi:hypothetical protein